MKIFKNRELEDIYGIKDIIFTKNMLYLDNNIMQIDKKQIQTNNNISFTKISDSKKENTAITDKKSLMKKENNTIISIGDKTLQMNELSAEIKSCKDCELHKSRNNIVLGDGSLDAKLMFIGEAPGADEDATGKPFVGKAGQLLTKMIEAMGLKREDVYIANIAKCRPPNNRNPFEDEALSCIHFLYRQLRIINPDVIVTLGSVATRYLLSVNDNISRIRGNWQNINGYDVMPSFHPAYLLRSPNKKKEAWEDLQLVMQRLGL